MSNIAFYTVVENAGYVGECDVRSDFPTAHAAWKWIDSTYDEDEKESLHVDVRRDPEGTYDF